MTGALEKAFGAIAEAGTSAIEEATKMAEKMAGLTGETARAAGRSRDQGDRRGRGCRYERRVERGEDRRDHGVHSAEAAKSAGEIASKAAHAASEMGSSALKSAEAAATQGGRGRQVGRDGGSQAPRAPRWMRVPMRWRER